MTALYHLNENIAHLLEGFLESAVPLIAGLAEAIGLFIIVTSLARATYHYVRTTFFHENGTWLSRTVLPEKHACG